jgi:hypothetical protein
MIVKLPSKFADKNLDEFINKIYSNHEKFPNDKYHFDLTEVEFIGNQELLVLSALFKSFIESNVQFEIEFFKKGIPTSEIPNRVKRQIIQFWEVWKIWKIVPSSLYEQYFGLINGNSVERLQKELKYYPKLSEIYNRHGITPFISLDFLNNYNEVEVQKIISPIYRLNSVIEDLLKANKCHHPFTSNLLSTIITEELYLNFLDHSMLSSFSGFEKFAFMSISFEAKIDDEKTSHIDIQKIKEINFKTECIPESFNFFYDKKLKKYKNESYIQFSFLDFGQGIVRTLTDQFKKTTTTDSKYSDSDILRFAFNHDSSRHPIFSEQNKIEQFIPRGLFDILTVVRRYKGLLVVRSNYGKILFDFSSESDIQKAFSHFGNEKQYFPGSLISLFIPTVEDTSQLNVSSIKPEIDFVQVPVENKKYININAIAEKLKVDKDALYSTLLRELKKEILSERNHSLVFISFKGCERLEKRLLKKTIYFLLSDYDINYHNNVIILNSPPQNLLDEIESEILLLNDALKNYKLHPLPIVDFNEDSEDIKLRWLGVYDEEDKKKLDYLLFEQYSLAKSDFNDPSKILGHLNIFDKYGNLLSNFPARAEVIAFFYKEKELLISKEIEDLLLKHKCFKKDDTKSLYLCNGNYYQREYLELNNLVNDKVDCKIIASHLYDNIKKSVKLLDQFKFIGVTTTSQKILSSLESLGLIKASDYLTLDNYQAFESELSSETVNAAQKYILVCDVISTGYLSKRLDTRLRQLGAQIEYIAVVSSILSDKFEFTKSFIEEFSDRIISIHKNPIEKFNREEIKKELALKNIIRVNPHTNIPITLSISETNFDGSIIFHSSISYDVKNNDIKIANRFLEAIDEEAINVGFYKFNNVIHPYFFNTDLILRKIDNNFLKEIFNKINKKHLEKERIQIFYPRKSGIESFDISKVKAVLGNQFIDEIEIERFGTTEGWRFPHNTDYLNALIKNNICFILDDGSCSGDSLIQMIDEISFYSANEIILLCFIGRVNDHKREFFSRLASIKVKEGRSIPISIYFGCHWHIPTYYLDENPNTKEILWLNELVNLQNTPQIIKSIAGSIIKQISPKGKEKFQDYKYLPKTKDSNKIPKKDLLLIREELGKVIGYRLYKESFTFFDYFMKKYEIQEKSKDRYKEIELLCGTFIYEPYLYDKVAGILPDVAERIESFVRVLIFSDLKIYDSLTYKWNKKDIVHLFFIVFKNEKLLQELDEAKFKKLIEFTEPKESALNYVLYKLLKYFSIKDNQLEEKKFDRAIKDLLVKLKSGNSTSNKEIKKYYNFISTLPSGEDFNSQLRRLVDNYSKQSEPEFHDDKISFNHNVSRIITLIRLCVTNIEEGELIKTETIEIIRERWFEILNFITPILSFSIRFKEFLLPFPYFRLINKVEGGNNSLRGMVGFNEDVIFALNESFNDIEKLKLLEKKILQIQIDFKVDSDFHKLISERQSNLKELVDGLCNGIKNASLIFDIKNIAPIDLNVPINIPKVYSDILIQKELLTNLNNHSRKDKDSKIEIEYMQSKVDTLEIKIQNTVSELASSNSNGEGIKCLRLLSDSKLFGFSYDSKTVGANFIQILTFNLN